MAEFWAQRQTVSKTKVACAWESYLTWTSGLHTHMSMHVHKHTHTSVCKQTLGSMSCGSVVSLSPSVPFPSTLPLWVDPTDLLSTCLGYFRVTLLN